MEQARQWFASVCVGAALVLAGCQAQPRPSQATAAAAVAQERPREEGVFQTAGVTLIARAPKWLGEPENLPDLMTPVELTVRNQGHRPLRLRYAQFALIAGNGERVGALTPFSRAESKGAKAISPEFPAKGLLLAPYLGRHFPRRPVYQGGFPPSAGNPGMHQGALANRMLPTEDMQRKALPEGVLEPGGEVTGYLYFGEMSRPASGLLLHAELVDATGKPLGSGEIRLAYARRQPAG